MVNLLPSTNIFTQPQQFGIADLISLIKLQNEQANDAKARAMPSSPSGPSGPSGSTEAPSENTFPKIVGGASAGATGGSSDVMNAVHGAWSNQGASPHAIAGVMANISEESGFNPTLRHPDQPAYGGEAHYAHGLYQEGGAEWNNYSKWLQQNHPGADWRDGGMQSQFAAWRLRTGYPKTWQKMNNAESPAEAASIYAKEYLRPATKYLNSRVNKFTSRGVPGLDAWMAKANVSRAKAEEQQGQPIKRFAQGGIVTEPTLAMIGENGPEAVVPLYNKDLSAGPKVWTQTADRQRPIVNVTPRPTEEDPGLFKAYEKKPPVVKAPQEAEEDPGLYKAYEKKPPGKQYAGPEGGPFAGRPEEPLDAGQAKFNRYADAINTFRKASSENQVLIDVLLGGPTAKIGGVGAKMVGEGARTVARPLTKAAAAWAAEHPLATKIGRKALEGAAFFAPGWLPPAVREIGDLLK